MVYDPVLKSNKGIVLTVDCALRRMTYWKFITRTAITTTIVRLTCCYCTPTATMSLTASGIRDKDPATGELDASRACPACTCPSWLAGQGGAGTGELAEGAHVGFPLD
jgi:hypothetical protein